MSNNRNFHASKEEPKSGKFDGTGFNPIRSEGGFKPPPPPPIFCPHAFNFGAALLCVGDFSQKIV